MMKPLKVQAFNQLKKAWGGKLTNGQTAITIFKLDRGVVLWETM